LPGQENGKTVDLQNKRFGSGRESANGSVASPGAGNFRGGFAPRGSRGGRGRGGFENKFGGVGSGHNHAGPSVFRGGANHAGNTGPSNFRGGASNNSNHVGSAGPSNVRSGATNHAGNATPSSVRGGAPKPRGPSNHTSGTSTPKPMAQSQFASKNEYAALAAVPQGVSNW
jgi:hypothetical protein